MDFFRYYNINRIDIELSISVHSAHDVKKVDSFIQFLHCLQRQAIEIWPLQSIRDYEGVLKAYEEAKANNARSKSRSSIKIRKKIKQFADDNKQKYQEWRVKLHHIGNKDEILEFLKDSDNVKDVELVTDCLDRLIGYNFEDKKLVKLLETSKILIFCLTKAFVNSKAFDKQQIKELKAKKRNYLFVLLDDVNIDEYKIEKKRIFKIFKHEHDGFFGYETRKLFGEMGKVLSKDLPLEYRKKNQVYLAHNYGGQFEDLRKKLEAVNIKIWSKNNIKYPEEEILECLDEIEKSSVVVFLLTNSYLESHVYRCELEASKQLGKVILFVLMENINENLRPCEFNEFNTINYSQKRHLLMLILRVFGRDSYLNEDSSLKSIQWNKSYFKTKNPIHSIQRKGQTLHLEDQKSNYGEVIKVNFIDIPSRDQFVVATRDQLRFYDRKTAEFDKEFYIQEIRYSLTHVVAWIEHLNLFCTYYASSLMFINDSGQIINTIPMKPVEISGRTSIEYNISNRKIYLVTDTRNLVNIFNEDLICEKTVKLRADNGYQIFIKNHLDKIYAYSYGFQCVHVYDLDMNYVTAFGFSVLNNPEFIFTDSINTNYLLVYDSFQIFVFQLHNYKCIGCLQQSTFHDIRSGGFMWNKRFLVDSVFGIRAYDNVKYNMINNRLIRSEGIHNTVDPKYICKLNQVNQHLYRDPYVLPCGNLACIDCIYDNFNIFTKKFKCNFDNCKLEHDLKRNELKKSKLSVDYQLVSELLEAGERFTNHTRGFIDQFEARLETIEFEIECRVESIKIELDMLNETLITEIDKFEKKLVGKKHNRSSSCISMSKLINIDLIGKLKFKDVNEIKGWVAIEPTVN